MMSKNIIAANLISTAKVEARSASPLYTSGTISSTMTKSIAEPLATAEDPSEPEEDRGSVL